MKVTHHPVTGWETDSLGETRAKTFGPDVEREAFAFDPGGSQELNVDSAVTTNPAIYFHIEVPASAHDEWTVRGLRYQQDGEAAVWENPTTGDVVSTVVHLQRRTG